MKKIVSLIFAGLLICTSVFFVGCNDLSDNKSGATVNDSVLERPIPSASSVGVTFGATRTVETGDKIYIEKEINVEVRPSKADPRISLSVAWSDETKTEDVSEYVEIVHASPENHTAYLRVYKSFGDDVIVLKVESVLFPEKFATCELRYVGFLSSFEVSITADPGLVEQEESYIFGEYYRLYSSRDFIYYIDLNSHSIFGGEVGAPMEFNYSVRASTGLYIGDFQVFGGNGGGFSNVRYVTEDELFSMMFGIPYPSYPMGDTNEVFNMFLRYSIDDMLSNPLTPYFCNDLHPLVSSADTRDTYKNVVVFGSGNDLISGNVTDDGVDMAKANEEAMTNFYFILTIMDRFTGISEEIKIVIFPAVESIEAPESVEV